jgi:hypothetical protein
VFIPEMLCDCDKFVNTKTLVFLGSLHYLLLYHASLTASMNKYSELKIPELRNLLKERNIRSTGRKNELIAR